MKGSKPRRGVEDGEPDPCPPWSGPAPWREPTTGNLFPSGKGPHSGLLDPDAGGARGRLPSVRRPWASLPTSSSLLPTSVDQKGRDRRGADEGAEDSARRRPSAPWSPTNPEPRAGRPSWPVPRRPLDPSPSPRPPLTLRDAEEGEARGNKTKHQDSST